MGNPDIHARFLDSLSLCFSEKTEVIIISDAGFQGHWFRQIRSHGWVYVCRVLGAQYYKINEEWEKVTKVMDKASCTPVYLGNGLLIRDKRAQHEGHFYLYKSRTKGRKFKRSKDRAARAMMTKKKPAGRQISLVNFHEYNTVYGEANYEAVQSQNAN